MINHPALLAITIAEMQGRLLEKDAELEALRQRVAELEAQIVPADQ